MNEKYVPLENAIDLLKVLLKQQGGLTNEKNNMVYNVTGLIERLEELKESLEKNDSIETD